MATQTADTWTNLRAWLAADPTKSAGSLPEKDDGGKPATEGSRSSENSADVNKIVPDQNVDKGKDNPTEITGGTHAVPGSGLNQSTSGKNPEVEKAVKNVTDESDKMASAKLETDDELAAALATFNKLAADMNTLIGSARAPEQPATRQNPAKAAADAPGAAPARQQPDLDKVAADVCASYAKYGADRGLLTARCLLGFEDAYYRLKQAEEDGSLQDMAQQGGGGAPPEMPPEAAGGAMPPEAAGGAPGGAPGGDDMAGAMGELNLSPEELEQLIAMLTAKLQESQQGGAMPPEAAKAAREELRYATKLAAEAKAHMRSGNFRLKPAADGSPERKGRDAARAYIQELQRANA